MTEPVRPVNWQCPTCLRKWIVPADREAPALCGECDKIPILNVVRPVIQAGTPTSEMRDNSPDSIASNESQYCLWTCPKCQKRWRVLSPVENGGALRGKTRMKMAAHMRAV